MRAQHSRRALQLAAGLVAAGLCLTAAPQALAADSGSDAPMKLTSAEAKSCGWLIKRLPTSGLYVRLLRGAPISEGHSRPAGSGRHRLSPGS